VQTAVWREREQLEDIGCAPTAPPVTGNRGAVDRDGEPAQELDRRLGHQQIVWAAPGSDQWADRNARGTVHFLASLEDGKQMRGVKN